jgi:hypothetical protein
VLTQTFIWQNSVSMLLTNENTRGIPSCWSGSTQPLFNISSFTCGHTGCSDQLRRRVHLYSSGFTHLENCRTLHMEVRSVALVCFVSLILLRCAVYVSEITSAPQFEVSFIPFSIYIMVVSFERSLRPATQW